MRCCTSTYNVHTLNTKKYLFQLKQSKCESNFNKVKFPRVGSNAILLGPINLDVKNIFDYHDPLFMSNKNYDCSYLMVKIMLMVGTVIFICDASSKLMCEITKKI
jgi:hypothetical protein